MALQTPETDATGSPGLFGLTGLASPSTVPIRGFHGFGLRFSRRFCSCLKSILARVPLCVPNCKIRKRRMRFLRRALKKKEGLRIWNIGTVKRYVANEVRRSTFVYRFSTIGYIL